MKCVDCPYSWKDEGNKAATCHYSHNDGCAPCEVEEVETPDDYYGD